MDYVIAVDPGGTAGIAEWNRGDHRAYAVPFHEAGAHIQSRIAKCLPDLVVCESYTISGGSLKKDRAGQMQAIKLIGVVEYLCQCYQIEFITQSPSDAMGFATDAKLRQIGWWTKGVDHPRAASRHLLLALAQRRAIDLRTLLI